jgi:pyruvate kinase
MMESMINSPIPTRAEVLDVANAVMDGTDAVMLSAETATGKYPVKTVQAMARVCEGAEKVSPELMRALHRQESHFERTDEAIAMATAWTARNMHADAIMSLTESGSTPLLLSRTDTRIPIYALTRHQRTRRRMALCRGVYPVDFTPSTLDNLAPVRESVEELKKRKLLKDGDRVLMTKGDFTGSGGTNEMKIIKVGA